MAIHIDDSRFPLVVIRYVGSTSDQEFEQYLSQMEELVLARRATNAVILDASKADAASATQRRMQAEWMKAHETTLRRYSVGNAFVITSTVVRGALTAIFWLQPPAVPSDVFSTYAAAEAWALERLAAAGAAIPGLRRAASGQ